VPTCTSCGRDSAGDYAFCPHCGARLAPAAPAREQRKVVTVLFCDVTGSTEIGEALDPEALRALLARYFERMKGIVESHGGTVEKFIGDAVMAVFGVPVVHEDDALRAARAAVEMRDAFAGLGLRGRIGVMTGEVVAGTEERLATGDAVNVAARLQQAAAPNEVLIGAETLALLRDAAAVEPLAPLSVKGKARPVAVSRLLSVHGRDGFVRRLDAPMIGRAREQRLLADAWDRVVSESSCHLFTILGVAGVGKSRLTAEFLGSLTGALVAEGRCPPYGEGITYAPVLDALGDLPETPVEPEALELLSGLGGGAVLVSSSHEIAWAVRRRLESAASDRPLVCVFDDLQWGEETFLDLVEHVADLSRGHPILLLCMARPELLDRRPAWAGGKVNATTVLLEPLGPEETAELVERLAPPDAALRERIAAAAEGNPLFVEEMVAMLEGGDPDALVPPTIQALLAARLDQLGAERSILEAAAVEGRTFHRGAAAALTDASGDVDGHLASLVRKELVRPDDPRVPGEEAFRFRHLLIRDAAYDALPKSARAELHVRYADWLAERGADLADLDEFLGHHLAEAARYRAELGVSDGATAARACASLAAAGSRAHTRGDLPGARRLLEHAARLAVPAVAAVLLIELGEIDYFSGDLAAAGARFAGAAERAAELGERALELEARLLAEWAMLNRGDTDIAALRPRVERAMEELERLGAPRALAHACVVLGAIEQWEGYEGRRRDVCARGERYAEAAGDERLRRVFRLGIAVCDVYGPTPVDRALLHHEQLTPLEQRHPLALGMRGILEAMLGHVDRARSLVDEARRITQERGDLVRLAFTGQWRMLVDTYAGEPAASEDILRESCRRLEEMGDRGWLPLQLLDLSHVLLETGRRPEAEELAAKAEALGARDDATFVIAHLLAQSRFAFVDGDLERAERLAREAMVRAEQMELVDFRARPRLQLAAVLAAAQRPGAAGLMTEALGIYRAKGNVAMAAQVERALADVS
jgi:class 3 adenylate cyclase/tetratricopeptide (TPR) repeat protein